MIYIELVLCIARVISTGQNIHYSHRSMPSVGLVSSHFVGKIVVIGVHIRADAYGGSFGIIVDHGV